ncbi:hypothetical protein RKD49_005417 [Streptomyces glaucescens]
MNLTTKQIETLEAFKANGAWTHFGNEFKIDRRSLPALLKAGLIVQEGTMRERNLTYRLA